MIFDYKNRSCQYEVVESEKWFTVVKTYINPLKPKDFTQEREEIRSIDKMIFWRNMFKTSNVLRHKYRSRAIIAICIKKHEKDRDMEWMNRLHDDKM